MSSRLPLIDPVTATGRAKEIFDGPLKGKTFNVFKAMANAPAALDVYLAMSGALGKASLGGKEREVIQLAIGQANSCDYCVAAHTAIGRQMGLTEDQTREARRGRMTDPKLNALAHFALAINEKKGFASDADVGAFKAAGFTDAHIAEVMACIALAIYTNWFNHLNKTPTDFPAPPAL